ncbi:uncharacterized protein H6S33_004373 [Morchella sextelata]|uniref:uncharacterized protein n=1 Tax=Morchella sextelata TaxID=1174677 RepID=UPI001D04B8D1|nr:uncharacterized protein H6S33_004373 [Morchella sextelata]KAH0605916.1 hypothetical protein H6S33_004373 [Morchella sextelata]
MTTLRLNSSQTVLRLIRLQRTTRTTLILPHIHCRNFNVTALEAKRLAMEKQREQLYSKWSHSELITRILELEKSQETVKQVQPRKAKKTFDSSAYSTRHIALKIAYLGANYGGFEYHANNPFSTPTVEEQIFKALLKGRLVPHNGLPGEEETVLGWPGDEAVEYSKCGRTDKGVSAFGQVIGVRVRSNRPLPAAPRSPPAETTEDPAAVTLDDSFGADLTAEADEPSTPEFSDADELLYPQILNRLLPPDIRVLAWCPNPPEGFSARFNCEERRYRYFFTNPPIPPGTAGTTQESIHLDIDKMREAAALYVGDHDFRNFCKIDASKQISRFDRIIRHASINEVVPQAPTFGAASGSATEVAETGRPKTFYFELHGSAFLWHQVRHMVAMLFLVGQGLEEPSIITELLDTKTNPCKPHYEMANDRCLVLWDCMFPEGMLRWEYESKAELTGDVWKIWHKAAVDEVLAGGLLDVIAAGGGVGVTSRELKGSKKSQVIVDGGHAALLRGKYMPVMKRKRMEEVEVINKRYVDKKGDWMENRNRRVEARSLRAKTKEREEENELVEEVVKE